jgi:glycosyltransferase involved in cell wall biosynthesis
MIICTTRLTPQCQFDLLLEAQARLRAEGRIVNVLLVGDGPERDALHRLAIRLGVTVNFYGECYDETELAGLTMAAHATVSPGKVGLTAIQSLAYGTPVITHSDFDAQMPECEAIVPGKSGDFFERNNVFDLARVIRNWTASEAPEPHRRAECYDIIERFYNPEFQARVIDRAVSGLPADDLFWMKTQDLSTEINISARSAPEPLAA